MLKHPLVIGGININPDHVLMLTINYVRLNGKP